MSTAIVHQMNILPSPEGGYSLRRVGDSPMTTRARIVPRDDASGQRGGEDSGSGRRRNPDYLSRLPQLTPDEFARQALGIDSFRQIRNRGEALPPGEARSRQEGSPEPGKEENPVTGETLDATEQARLRELQARDAEVRAHEAAHMGAAGGIAVSGARYSYTTGPDGQQYATGGEVSIDTSEAATPEETVEKARKIQAAALAPANPSSTDLRVAAQAASMAMQASAEMAEEKQAREAGEGDQTEFPFAAEVDREAGSGMTVPVTADDRNGLLQRVMSRYLGGGTGATGFLAYA